MRLHALACLALTLFVVAPVPAQTLDIKEWPVEWAGSDGMIWYAGNGDGRVGRMDPSTGKAVTFLMPDPAARDPLANNIGRAILP